MNTHQKFLEFNGKNIVFLSVQGTYWVALKPILNALNLESERYLKRTKRDYFFGRRLDTMSIQVENNGIIQGRNMVCLPEKYIYGWICILNSDNKDLEEYKETCYDLLYDHFHGTITNRKEIINERLETIKKIEELKKQLKQSDEVYQELAKLQQHRKTLSQNLNSLDNELMNQTEIKFN